MLKTCPDCNTEFDDNTVKCPFCEEAEAMADNIKKVIAELNEKYKKSRQVVDYPNFEKPIISEKLWENDVRYWLIAKKEIPKPTQQDVEHYDNILNRGISSKEALIKPGFL